MTPRYRVGRSKGRVRSVESGSRRSPGGFDGVVRAAVRPAVGQWEQPFGAPSSSAVRKLEPQPQAATAFGLLTVKPAPIRVST